MQGIFNFLLNLLNGIIANAIFTLLLIYVVQKIRYYFKLRRHFHNASFDVFWKRFPDEVIITAKCKVKGHRIVFTGAKNNKIDPFEGEFVLNPFNLKFGKGYYSHSKSEGYAFVKVIIKDKDTLLVDAPYTKVVEKENEKKKKHKIGSIVYQSYVWRRAND